MIQNLLTLNKNCKNHSHKIWNKKGFITFTMYEYYN